MKNWNSKVTLADYFLYSKESVSWSITSGTEHYATSFPAREKDLKAILERAKEPVSLVIEGGNGKRVEIKKVWITGEVVSADPRWRRVGVADIRWPLLRGKLVKKYNMRTFVGSKRKVGAVLELLGVATTTTVDDLAYKAFSMDSGLFPPSVPLAGIKQKPHTSVSMLTECLKEIRRVYPFFEYELDDGLLKPYEGLVIEDFSVDASMSEVLESILSWISAIDCYPDIDGVLRFYDRTKGGEEAILQKMGFEQEGYGHVEKISHHQSCPSSVEIIFTPKAEIRFDRNEDTNASTVAPEPKEGRYLESLIMVVEDSLKIKKGGKVIRTAYKGEFVTVEEWVESVNGLGGVALTHDKIQTYLFTGGMLNEFARVSDTLSFSEVWGRRVSSLERFYRRCFRPNRRWTDRVLGFENKLISTIDTESGYRPPSPVMTNYCLRFSDRAVAGAVLARGRGDMMKNFTGYSIKSQLAEVCPYAEVQFLDTENGIFYINSKRDDWGWIDQVIPSHCENIPTFDIGTLRQTTRPRFRSEATRGGKHGKMSSKHDLAVILTASPASNDQDSYFKITVFPEEISTAFGIAKEKIMPAFGPKWQYHVPPGATTANVAWLDGYSEHIERIFGIGQVKIDWSSILVNEDTLKKLALAYAFQSYVPFVQKYEGSKTSQLNPEIKPNGSVGTVTHFVSNAVARTTATISRERYPRKLETLLDQGTRAQIFGMVKQ
jgi:hypothetical protein